MLFLLFPTILELSKGMKKIIVIIFATFIIASCIEQVNLTIESSPSLLVVEGGISNGPGPYKLKLTRTTAYKTEATSIDEPEIIYDAKVMIIDVTDYSYTSLNLNLKDGYYYTPTSFNGIIGHKYYLEIQWNNNTYESDVHEIQSVPELDDIYYELIEESEEIGIYVDFKDDEEENQFYRWKWNGIFQLFTRPPNPELGEPDTAEVCCNTCYVAVQGVDIRLMEDRLVNGNNIVRHLITKLEIDGPRGPTDYLVNVEQIRISEGEYDFWKQVKEQADNEGGLFDPLPSRISGNIKNVNNADEIVLGYFSVSDITRDYIKVHRMPFSKNQELFSGAPTQDCRLSDPNATNIPPENW